MNNFHPLEVVGRGSETQLQVVENLKKDNSEGKGLKASRAIKTLPLTSPENYLNERHTKLASWSQITLQ